MSQIIQAERQETVDSDGIDSLTQLPRMKNVTLVKQLKRNAKTIEEQKRAFVPVR